MFLPFTFFACGLLKMAADAMDRCIAACVKDGMKLQFALKKFNVQLGSSGKNEYRRLYRTINKLKKQEVAETSALFCFDTAFLPLGHDLRATQPRPESLYFLTLAGHRDGSQVRRE